MGKIFKPLCIDKGYTTPFRTEERRKPLTHGASVGIIPDVLACFTLPPTF